MPTPDYKPFTSGVDPTGKNAVIATSTPSGIPPLPAPGYETANPNDSPYAFGPNRPGDFKAPAVVTTTAVADATKKNVADLAAATTPQGPTPGGNIVNNQYINPKGVLTDARTGQPVLTKNPDGSERDSLGNIITPAPIKETAVDKALAGTTPTTPPPVTKTQAELDAEKAILDGQAEIERVRAQMDSRAASIIDGISREYDALIKQQEVANRAYEGGTTTEGLVSGRARYAPVMQGALIKQAVDQGIAEISKLQTRKQQLIMEAQQARDEGSLKALNEKMTAYREAVKTEREIAQKTYENAIKASQEARDQAKAIREEDEARASDIAGGLIGMLTDNAERNSEIIKQAAIDVGIEDANILLKAVDEYRLRTGKTEESNKTAMTKEYEYAVRNGFFDGSLLDYIQVRGEKGRAKPTSRVTSSRDAASIGLQGLAGLNEDEIVYDLTQEIAPQWFIDKIQSERKQSLLPEVVKMAWDDYKSQPEVQQYLSGDSIENTTTGTGSWQDYTSDGGYEYAE